MTVDELRAALADLPGDHVVVLAKDGEGNGYSPLATVESAFYLAYTTWSGDRYENDDDGVPAAFLWPVN